MTQDNYPYTVADPEDATGETPFRDALILSDTLIGRTRATRVGIDWDRHVREQPLPAERYAHWVEVIGDLDSGKFYLSFTHMPEVLPDDLVNMYRSFIATVESWARKAYSPYVGARAARDEYAKASAYQAGKAAADTDKSTEED